jgi:integrase
MVDKRVPTGEKGISKRRGNYDAFLTQNGRGGYRVIGPTTAMTLKEAVRRRAVWEDEIFKGTYKQKISHVVMFADSADQGLLYYKRQTASWDTPETHVNFFKQHFAGRTLQSITKTELDTLFFDDMIAKGRWKPATARSHLQTLRTIYAQAIKGGFAGPNVALMVERIQGKSERKRPLTYEEEALFREAMRKYWPVEGEYRLAQFDLALNTGMRRGNMYGIRGAKKKFRSPFEWPEVYLDYKVLRLKWSKKHPEEGYLVPLNRVAIAALKTIGDYTSQTATGPIIPEHTPRGWFEPCCKKAGIVDLVWHDLRHTYATRLRRARVPYDVISILMDHRVEIAPGVAVNPITLLYINQNMNVELAENEELREHLEPLHEAVSLLESPRAGVNVVPIKTNTETNTAEVKHLASAVGE